MPPPRLFTLLASALCLLAGAVPMARATSLLQLALDDDRVNYSAAGSGAGGGWTSLYDEAQCVDLTDGARSAVMDGAGESWITATFGGETIDFMWALEGPEQNTLTFSVDGVVKATCEAATVARWAYVSVSVPEGAHAIRWTYRQAGGLAGKAMLDRVGRPGDAGAGLTSSPWIKAVLGEPVDHRFTTRRPTIGWYAFSGGFPPGLSMDALTGQITGTPTEVGFWRPVITIYAQGSVIYYSIGMEVTEVPSLQGALDNSSLAFTVTASDNNVSLWQPQRDGGRDGGDCIVAGLPPPVQRAAPYQPGWSMIQTAVTGPDFLSCWVRVANGRVSLMLDGKEYRSQGPNVSLSGWQRVWLGIPEGAHTVAWKYLPFSGRTGTAWLDDVRLRSEGRAFITQQPEIAPLPAGTFNFTVPSANPTSGWAVSGLPAGLSLNTSSGTVSGVPQRRGVWPMYFSVDGPSGDRDQVQAILDASIPCDDAADLPNSWWSTDTKNGAGWFGQNEITHDGVDAVRSPVITAGSIASLTTSVQGPGTLRWWWHIPDGTGGDTCGVAVDGGKVVTSITGTTAWRQESLAIPAGHRLVSWRWKPDAEGDKENECAVVDQVSFQR